jgi:hypothetical protein
MSTFVVRFHDTAAGVFRGEARHVSTGETQCFSSAEQLLAFLEEMNAVSMSSAGLPPAPVDSDSSSPVPSGARSGGTRGRTPGRPR